MYWLTFVFLKNKIVYIYLCRSIFIKNGENDSSQMFIFIPNSLRPTATDTFQRLSVATLTLLIPL